MVKSKDELKVACKYERVGTCSDLIIFKLKLLRFTHNLFINFEHLTPIILLIRKDHSDGMELSTTTRQY